MSVPAIARHRYEARPLFVGRLVPIAIALSGVTFPGCANHESSPFQSTTLARQHSIYPIHWMQSSGEYAALCLQVFAAAGDYVEAHSEAWRARTSEGADERGPAVVVDLDETVLSNDPHDTYLALYNREFSIDIWRSWTHHGIDDVRVVPGADEFVQRMHRLGVRVLYVSDRSVNELDPTISVLRRLGLIEASQSDMEAARSIFLRPKSRSQSKQMRFSKLYRRFAILAYLGDNLGDFPFDFNEYAHDDESPAVTRRAKVYEDSLERMDQTSKNDQDGHLIALRRSLSNPPRRSWGRGWFILPNPVYGEWRNVLEKEAASEHLRVWCPDTLKVLKGGI